MTDAKHLSTAYCEACAVHIRKHHAARHRQSKGHKARINATYPVRASDIAFTAFLQGVRGVQFRGYEAQLYSAMRSQFLGFTGVTRAPNKPKESNT